LKGVIRLRFRFLTKLSVRATMIVTSWPARSAIVATRVSDREWEEPDVPLHDPQVLFMQIVRNRIEGECSSHKEPVTMKSCRIMTVIAVIISGEYGTSTCAFRPQR
jgi:hypothetical protein